MSYQWRHGGRLCWYSPADMRVYYNGVFVGLAQSKREAEQVIAQYVIGCALRAAHQ